jgi:hypothetical protein
LMGLILCTGKAATAIKGRWVVHRRSPVGFK